MEWTKLNKKEVIYYCKSFEVDFSCSPFSLQLEELVLMFHYYGIEQFTVKDIQDFYQKMQIPKPKKSRTHHTDSRQNTAKYRADAECEIYR